MPIRRGWLIVAFLSLWLPCTATAAEERPLWEAGAGVGVLNMPEYRGSDERRWVVLPYPYLIYRGDILRVERERISGRLFQTDRVLLDFSFNGSIPVDSGKNTARSGMPDLDPTFEVGPSLNVKLWEGSEEAWRLNLFLPLRALFSTDFSTVRHEGWVFHPQLVFEKRDLIPQSGLSLGISAGPFFADSGYHRYFYEVEPAYARATRPAYAAGGGYSGSKLSVGLSKRVGPVIISAFVSVDWLQGAAIADSPLVKRETSVMTGMSLSWVFFSSKQKAADR